MDPVIKLIELFVDGEPEMGGYFLTDAEAWKYIVEIGKDGGGYGTRYAKAIEQGGGMCLFNDPWVEPLKKLEDRWVRYPDNIQ